VNLGDFIRISGQLPNRCGNCKEIFFRQDIKGKIPVFGQICRVICSCHNCNAVTFVPLPSFLISAWYDNLDDLPPISKEEVVKFERIIDNSSEEFMKEIVKNISLAESVYEKMMEENDEIVMEAEEIDLFNENDEEDPEII
jgi:hypothetical protein